MIDGSKSKKKFGDIAVRNELCNNIITSIHYTYIVLAFGLAPNSTTNNIMLDQASSLSDYIWSYIAEIRGKEAKRQLLFSSMGFLVATDYCTLLLIYQNLIMQL